MPHLVHPDEGADLKSDPVVRGRVSLRVVQVLELHVPDVQHEVLHATHPVEVVGGKSVELAPAQGQRETAAWAEVLGQDLELRPGEGAGTYATARVLEEEKGNMYRLLMTI